MMLERQTGCLIHSVLALVAGVAREEGSGAKEALADDGEVKPEILVIVEGGNGSPRIAYCDCYVDIMGWSCVQGIR